MKKLLKYLSVFMLVTVLVISTNIISTKSASLQQDFFQILLPLKEQAWLENHSVITLSGDDANPPLNFKDAGGEITGISIDYRTLIASKIGAAVEYQDSTWSEALQKGLDHEVDRVVNASIREDRKPYLNFSESYLILPQALITLKDAPSISNLNQVCDLRVAVIANSVRVGQIEAYCPHDKVIEIDVLEDGLKLISEDSAEAIFDELAVTQYLIEKCIFSNLEIALTASTVDEEYQQIFAARCDDFVHIPLKDALIFDTLAKYLGVTYIYADLEDKDRQDLGASQMLFPEYLANLLPELLNALRQVTLIGHMSGLETTIEEIAEHDPRVAKSLQKMSARYDYPGVLELLPGEGDET